MRLSILLPTASLLGCLPVLAQSGSSEDPADLRGEIRRIVREEVRAALKEALGKEKEVARPATKKGDDTTRWRVLESKEKAGDADRIVVRKIDSELEEIDEVMEQIEIVLEAEDMQPRVLRLDDLGPDVKVKSKTHAGAHAFTLEGGKLVPVSRRSLQFEGESTGDKAATKSAAPKSVAPKKGAKAKGQPSTTAFGKNTRVVQVECIQVECIDGQVKVTCNGEECPAVACTGGTAVLSIECDENGRCKIETPGNSSCCSEAAECCEKEAEEPEAAECCEGCTSCEGGAGARPQQTPAKKAAEAEKAAPPQNTKAKKARTAAGIGIQ